MSTTFTIAKQLLARVGPRLKRTTLDRFQILVNFLELGRWMSEHGFVFKDVYDTRYQLFEAVSARVANERVLYLEFGVWKGETTRFWSQRLKHPQTCLHGFDSFEGLPEDWTLYAAKGTFSTHGVEPKIDDDRVTFFKGWFSDSLPSYQPPEHERLVVVMDADLYSSDAFVLGQIEHLIKPGSLIYFDDLEEVLHDARAFHEFMQHTGKRFAPVGAVRTLHKAFFECVA
jgi:O-methyltransferase